MNNYEIINTLTPEEQIRILKRLRKEIESATTAQVSINRQVMIIDGTRLFFDRDHLNTPFTLKSDVREIVKQYNEF